MAEKSKFPDCEFHTKVFAILHTPAPKEFELVTLANIQEKKNRKKENHVRTTICITRHHRNLCHWDKYLSSQGEKRDRIFGNDVYHAGRVSDARL